ncbi:hypothetical protein PoB_005829500 [Plakobranchus ocellatus]|uniref:Uncharacterized protein n=1 Tax=Plakobranchus ocellatus TaxID=259542 RepID=A0AAV4CIZ6_9GAST|nr:hypothetical protein PoB_005829500 [Plakobranchus ocellatus]
MLYALVRDSKTGGKHVVSVIMTGGEVWLEPYRGMVQSENWTRRLVTEGRKTIVQSTDDQEDNDYDDNDARDSDGGGGSDVGGCSTGSGGGGGAAAAAAAGGGCCGSDSTRYFGVTGPP